MGERKLTNQLQEWLNTPAEKRDLEIGAMLVRRIVRNPILADNLKKIPSRVMPMVEYKLKPFLPMMLADVQHEDVENMSKTASEIAKKRKLDAALPGTPRMKESNRVAKTEDFVKGKRADHDSLPEDIQALYAENLSIMQQMRHVRAKLLVIMEEKGSSCPDGDRYPFVKELIELDKKYLSNWELYDSYTSDAD